VTLRTLPLRAGELALAVGGGGLALFGVVAASGPSWHSMRGGEIDARIELDVRLRHSHEGGLALDASGNAFGMTVFGPRRVLVIPAATIERVAQKLETHGRIARGYLGVGLQPVELPDHHKGLIVLSLESKGPAGKAGILIGDILVQLGGKPVQDTDDIQLALEGRAVGQSVAVDILRGGESRQIAVTIAERPRSN